MRYHYIDDLNSCYDVVDYTLDDNDDLLALCSNDSEPYHDVFKLVTEDLWRREQTVYYY